MDQPRTIDVRLDGVRFVGLLLVVLVVELLLWAGTWLLLLWVSLRVLHALGLVN